MAGSPIKRKFSSKKVGRKYVATKDLSPAGLVALKAMRKAERLMIVENRRFGLPTTVWRKGKAVDAYL